MVYASLAASSIDLADVQRWQIGFHARRFTSIMDIDGRTDGWMDGSCTEDRTNGNKKPMK